MWCCCRKNDGIAVLGLWQRCGRQHRTVEDELQVRPRAYGVDAHNTHALARRVGRVEWNRALGTIGQGRKRVVLQIPADPRKVYSRLDADPAQLRAITDA